ncbi:MAG: pantoate--beta-alanine ligase [Verrucomicrobiota bacterium]
MEVITTVLLGSVFGIEDQCGRKVRALVPTMGALHAGHTSLIDLARERLDRDGGGELVVTIFVNPTQFGPHEDLDAYPRTLEADLELCEKHGATHVVAPSVGDTYAPDSSLEIHETSLSKGLCGKSRPGHFDGVCLIVAKLFNLIQPTFAVFGENDFQQLAVIRRMVRDLSYPIEIVAGPTVRERDGLALSSRNRYLSAEEREAAPAIYNTLREVASGVASGAFENPEESRRALASGVSAPACARLDYAAVVDSESLRPVEHFDDGSVRLITAAFYGSTRLIDNIGVDRFIEENPTV